MRRPSSLALILTALVLLTGCTAGADAAGPAPTHTSEPAPTQNAEAVAAEQQAQVWLDAAVVPPGAARVEEKPVSFASYYGWPCQPVATLTGYWTLPDATVGGAINWLRENPTADLVSTAGGMRLPEDLDIGEAAVGYVPADGSQQGIVYTVTQVDAGVAIRAEVAALEESATCPSMAPGETMGKPGQG